MNTIRITLTQTSNPYLAPRLPLTGSLELFSMATNGRISVGVFREDRVAGQRPAGPVTVGDIGYTADDGSTYLDPRI